LLVYAEERAYLAAEAQPRGALGSGENAEDAELRVGVKSGECGVPAPEKTGTWM
jgi:hypothetical protein